MLRGGSRDATPMRLAFPAVDAGALRLRAVVFPGAAMPTGEGVKAEAGCTLVQAAVWLRPHAGGDPATRPRTALRVGPDESNCVGSIPPGRYTLRVLTPLASCRTIEREVAIHLGASSDVQCELTDGLAAEGQVTDTFSGDPVPYVRVSTSLPRCDCHDDHQDVRWPVPPPGHYEYSPAGRVHPSLCSTSGRVLVSTVTDAQGCFRLLGLADADTEISLRYYGRAIGSRAIRPGGDPARWTIDGRPAVKLVPPERPVLASMRVVVDGRELVAAEGVGYMPSYAGQPREVHGLAEGSHLVWVHGAAERTGPDTLGSLFVLDHVPGRPLTHHLEWRPIGQLRYRLVDAQSGAGLTDWRVVLSGKGREIAAVTAWSDRCECTLPVPLDQPLDVHIEVPGYAPVSMPAIPVSLDEAGYAEVRLNR